MLHHLDRGSTPSAAAPNIRRASLGTTAPSTTGSHVSARVTDRSSNQFRTLRAVTASTRRLPKAGGWTAACCAHALPWLSASDARRSPRGMPAQRSASSAPPSSHRRRPGVLDRHRVRRRRGSLDDRVPDPPTHDPGPPSARSCSQSESRYVAVPEHRLALGGAVKAGARTSVVLVLFTHGRSPLLMALMADPSCPPSVVDRRGMEAAPVRITPRILRVTASRIEVRKKGSEVSVGASRPLQAAVTLCWALTVSKSVICPCLRQSRFGSHTPRSGDAHA